MLISEPPVSDSPSAPDTLMLTSCELAMSAVYPPVCPTMETAATGVDHLAVDEDATLLQVGLVSTEADVVAEVPDVEAVEARIAEHADAADAHARGAEQARRSAGSCSRCPASARAGC